MLSRHVTATVVYFDPQPHPDELPARMPSPFAQGEPHPLARRAAAELRRELDGGLARELGLHRDGKMFGVLVVRDRAGRAGYVRAFSGMVDRRWEVPGFVGPAFDRAARDAFWIAGEQELIELAEQLDPIDAQITQLRAALDGELAALKAKHRAAKQARRIARTTATDEDAARLDRESAREGRELTALKAAQQIARAQLAALVERRAAIDGERTARSRGLLVRIHDTYALMNARGEAIALRALFAPAEPPGGAGDCAAPKLLAHAYRAGLDPIALAELWCGAASPTGDRKDGVFYAACRGKCGPILAHMLGGLGAEPPPTFGEAAVDPAAPETLFEDDFLAIVVKPEGLLSVPARSGRADSVLARLRRRYPAATGPLLPHRLDLDTSGLMLVAKDAATHGALQRQFSERMIAKRYIAILDGEPAETAGVIDLPLRVDLDDRPRQIVDPVHGRPALTEWQVLARSGGRTRVALLPRTGRAHQLRVHAAHPAGIGIPIVGDRLYGRPDGRLMLHAESLAFVHPHTRAPLRFDSAAPF
jgi:tRNA pseudouridine32 synthase/23S rRNA pseudouridine746 synthase